MHAHICTLSPGHAHICIHMHTHGHTLTHSHVDTRTHMHTLAHTDYWTCSSEIKSFLTSQRYTLSPLVAVQPQT
jgi:hypothetical protein